jgi:hypothetical protein
MTISDSIFRGWPKKSINRALCLIVPVLLFQFSTAQVTLFKNGYSGHCIVIPFQPAPDEERAAIVLRENLEKITGSRLEILTDNEPVSDREIILGNNRHLSLLKINPKFSRSGPDGFQILTFENHLIITGAGPAGTLNGVYTFLEEYLGCRMYSPEAILVPKMADIDLPKIKYSYDPFFTYRETHFPAKFDPEFREWHKLQSHHTGTWGMWVHTFEKLVPSDIYFEGHPEYFSEINGTRIPNSQLCLTNPEVFDVLVENLARKIAKDPEAKYWSVSQNDNYLACQCDRCRDAVAGLGGESALMITFVNRVAEKFPDKVISTLAYQYTRSAPKTVKPLPNVNIMLCSIECNRSMPLEKDPTSASFVKDLKDWSKLTGNILIWDYVVQFRNYISPFPNLDVLQPNLEFFADKGCRMMFQQGSGGSWSEFSELRTYLIAKLLWNPYQDADQIIGDFMTGFYGAAAPYLMDYLDMMNDELQSSGDALGIYGYPYDGIHSYLKPWLIGEYIHLFDQAESAVANDPVILARVKKARLPLDFAILDISLHRPDEDLSWVVLKNGRYETNPKMLDRLNDFVAGCETAGITMLHEHGLAPQEYSRKIEQYLMKSASQNLAYQKKVTLLSQFSNKYDVGGAVSLTDGLRGIDDYHFNWLGFEGADLEAVVDLGELKEIREVRADFLQDIQSWIFFPESFEVAYAAADSVYSDAGSYFTSVPLNQPGPIMQTFSVSFYQPVQARFVKVKANSIKICPGWHIGKGEKSWIFIDEVVIK